MRYVLTLGLLTTACGTAGENVTDAGKCVLSGEECKQETIKGEKGDTGSRGTAGLPGNQGAQGPQGQPGTDGQNGESCTVERVSNGAIISCPGSQPVLLLDGEDGEDGQAAPQTPYTVVDIINPCRQSGYSEVLLRLADNRLVAHYSSGNKQFLTIIGEGNYVLTDGSNCSFTVTSDLDVIDMLGNRWNHF